MGDAEMIYICGATTAGDVELGVNMLLTHYHDGKPKESECGSGTLATRRDYTAHYSRRSNLWKL